MHVAQEIHRMEWGCIFRTINNIRSSLLSEATIWQGMWHFLFYDFIIEFLWCRKSIQSSSSSPLSVFWSPQSVIQSTCCLLHTPTHHQCKYLCSCNIHSIRTLAWEHPSTLNFHWNIIIPIDWFVKIWNGRRYRTHILPFSSIIIMHRFIG